VNKDSHKQGSGQLPVISALLPPCSFHGLHAPRPRPPLFSSCFKNAKHHHHYHPQISSRRKSWTKLQGRYPVPPISLWQAAGRPGRQAANCTIFV